MTPDIEEKRTTDVLVIGPGSLLDQAIANLIMQEPGLHVASIAGDDPSALLDAKHTCPDVILLCETDSPDQTRICEVFKQFPIHEHLRVIVIRREDNVLEVYDKQYVELNHNANTDLITLIKDR